MIYLSTSQPNTGLNSKIAIGRTPQRVPMISVGIPSCFPNTFKKGNIGPKAKKNIERLILCNINISIRDYYNVVLPAMKQK